MAAVAMSMRGIDDSLCWGGGRTLALCCRVSDMTTPRHDCWSDIITDQFLTSAASHDSEVALVGFDVCCPNADCWASGHEPGDCCHEKFGPGGNPSCWAGGFTHRLCCQADGVLPWVEEMFLPWGSEPLYTVESFYSDSQYGPDFGYYSTGRVLTQNGNINKTSGNNFEHFTTYPMVLSPHFARFICRTILLAWIALGSPDVLPVLEFGAGSGQLGHDVIRCIKRNELGVAIGSPLRAWQRAVRYVIVERSPALAARQRSLGLRVVQGDAQVPSMCPELRHKLHRELKRFSSKRVTGEEAVHQNVGDIGIESPGILLSNELIDAFAPAKLRVSVDIQKHGPFSCNLWQEVRVVHLLHERDLMAIYELLRIQSKWSEQQAGALRALGEKLACRVVRESSIGRATLEAIVADEACSSGSASDSTCESQEARDVMRKHAEHCLPVFLALGELPQHLDLLLPAGAHDFRRRLRLDAEVRKRLRRVISYKTGPAAPPGTILLTGPSYRHLRHMVRKHAEAELELVKRTSTWKLATSLTEERCNQVVHWARHHESRLMSHASLFQRLGFNSMDLLVRFGEEGFIELADCLLSKGGFMVTIDYGTNFDALLHSSAASGADNILPPMYAVPKGSQLPDCHTEWTKCAGFIDWTTFIDFSNMAAAGRHRGWQPVYYGPQTALEQITPLQLWTVGGEPIIVPGYFALKRAGYPSVRTQLGRAISEFYGNDVEGGQPWSSFKLLVQFKAPILTQLRVPQPSCSLSDGHCDSSLQRAVLEGQIVLAPTFPLSLVDVDSCWSIDPTQIPVADQLHLQIAAGVDPVSFLKAVENGQMLEKINRAYASAYGDLQLSVRLVDWLVASEGCDWLLPLRDEADVDTHHASVFARLVNASRTERWPPWTRIWHRGRLKRVGASVIRVLLSLVAAAPTSPKKQRPFECAARRAVQHLCMPDRVDVVRHRDLVRQI
eukprot:TRINITY_DN55186_c0_g1_i1.p1 TRINITY_DN55186_c0_g1~~TRINITY_DN55186_c0_g1_i1.p1  ORF type:complete len:963 (+),score=80.68 TRINITY_DN55186_c0_g1_i1:26-2890(+)